MRARPLRAVAAAVNRALDAATGVSVVRSTAVGVRIDEQWVKRILYFDRLLERLGGVDGDVAECGVAGGQSVAMLATLVRDRGGGRRVYGFDSWAGLPEPLAEDLESATAVAEEGMFAWAAPSVVRRELRGHGLDARDVTLVRGTFAETLPHFQGRLALVHIDADLYESYRDALVHLWPKLSVGGIVAFDEYDLSDLWPGPKRAVDEFLPQVSAELERDPRIGKYYARKTS